MFFHFFHKFEHHCVDQSFISSIFMMLKCVEKAPAEEGASGQISKKCSSLFYNINFFKKPNKKKFTLKPKRYTAILLHLFLILYCLRARQKWKLKNGPKLPTLPYILFLWGMNSMKMGKFG